MTGAVTAHLRTVGIRSAGTARALSGNGHARISSRPAWAAPIIAPDDWTLHCVGRYRLRPALWPDRLMLQLLGFIIDCPDPMKLAAFYSQVTGAGSSDSADTAQV
jgi:hypothetical protein